MTKAEKLRHLDRLEHRCMPWHKTDGTALGFICFNLGLPYWSPELLATWRAQVEALPDDPHDASKKET